MTDRKSSVTKISFSEYREGKNEQDMLSHLPV